MEGFLFRQWGTDTRMDRSAIPGLNVRHLQYIATRPGAEFNPGCGFGLWGSLSEFAPAENINDLEQAKKLLRTEAERGRTIYRGLISLGEPDAAERGYYDRSKWEALVNANAAKIAKGLHIDPANFRWMASMHCAQGHPHVHLMYWDAGSEPRQEYIPEEQFNAYAEGIRASLNRFEYGEEIHQSQEMQTEALRQLRLELQAICRECIPGAELLNRKELINSDSLAPMTRQFQLLIEQLPAKGSLKYAYLSSDYRDQVNILTDQILELPGCKKALEHYLEATDQVSSLYGNSEKTTLANRDKALQRLHRELGNEILASLREVKKELEMDAPVSPEALQDLASGAVRTLLRDSPEYAALRELLPRDRIPVQQMREIPGFRAAEHTAMDSLFSDARIRIRLNAYAKNHSDSQTAYRDFSRAADQALIQMLREDAGYTREAWNTSTVEVVCCVARVLSQLTRQQQASSSLAMRQTRSRDRSREAKKDQAQQASQGSGWSPDI